MLTSLFVLVELLRNRVFWDAYVALRSC
jgi:hypothetical protein